ncbi:Mediator of RNA polymerase II transcription subunit 6 [Dissophora globulifera]|uniref:Mediator of RNA polymerase II transcription subunit 6 n=1 Tax=Dissophora globulifera TaxID=979702 RepID=A0A9P6UTK8_9FUNG|nr:Mediator of RNA polymerase II transcription subunit 6 [Dissophora globulifera]
MATGAVQAAGSNASNADQNLLNMEWRFHEWIMGVGGLNPDNVLDYFAQSPFWDPECNNAVLRMQTQFNNLGEMKQRLSEMTGVEFALVHERYPTLFVIQKQRRRSPQEVKPMAIYYVLQGSIYQCPDLQTLLSNRILGSLHHVESAFNEARVMTEFHPSTGYHWKSTITSGSSTALSVMTPATAPTPNATGAATAPAASQEFRTAVDRAIKNVDQRAHIQQLVLQSGRGAANSGLSGASATTTAAVSAAAAAAAAASAASDSKVKQEGGGANASGLNVGGSIPSSKGTPKAANKRRKKSEEASAAAASMGINTGAGGPGGNVQGRPVAGVASGLMAGAGGLNAAGAGGSPATPTTAPTKRRKKTKTTEPK